LLRDRYDAALPAARAFLELRPGSAWGHRKLAAALKGTGQKTAARDSYRRALELGPKAEFPQILYAQFLAEQGEPNEARRILELLWQSGSARADAAIALVDHLRSQRELTRCLPILEEAVRICPRHSILWQQMAGVRLELQGPQAGIEPIARAVELCPERGPFRAGLAQLLEKTGALDEAEKHYRRLLEVEPQNRVVYYWLADFLRKHRPQAGPEALQIAEKALSLPPRPGLTQEIIQALIEKIREQRMSGATP